MIVVKFCAGFFYKILWIKRAFHENQSTVIQNLLENKNKLST